MRESSQISSRDFRFGKFPAALEISNIFYAFNTQFNIPFNTLFNIPSRPPAMRSICGLHNSQFQQHFLRRHLSTISMNTSSVTRDVEERERPIS
jgi:hypothetical protein